MSDFKITGNPNPVVGKEEFYTIGNALFPLFPQTPAQKSPFDIPVLWTVHVLEYGRWRKTKENDKKGDKVSYTFLQRSLERNGIRIMASKGDQVARIDIKAQPADKPKIESIELLDKSGKKVSAPLSYGQTLKARVHCLHMESRKVYVTLWEDNAKGAGHNKANEKNLLEMRSGIVKDGIVDIDFLLKPSFAKIAKMSKDEGKIHEYYVTTDFDDKKLASKNVNVNDVETPVAPYKGKTTTPPQQPAKTTPPVQTTKPKTSASGAQTSPKGAIRKVHITDTANHAIKGVFKEKQLKVWIDSNGLIGKEIRLRLYDEDLISNDLLVDQKFTITSNIFSIIVTLNKIPRSKGGYSGEGDEQELFAEVEVLQTQKSTVSEIVNVDAKSFKQDQIEVTNKVMKVSTEKEEEKKKENVCACQNYDLIWGNKVSCEFRKKVIEISKGLGLPQAKNEGANWLMAVMALETGRTFSPTCGTFKKHKDDKKNGYVGLIQIGKVAAIDLNVKRSELIKLSATAQLDYVEKFFKQKKFDGKLKTKTDLYLAVNYPNACGHGTEKDYVVYDSTKDAYDDNPIFKREKDEYWIDKKGKKQYYEGKEGSSYVWEFEEAINELYNEGISEKVNFFGTCSIILNSIIEKDVITYNIYDDGKIEKSIPKAIKEGYENKYKYIYHDKNKKAHSICILDWYNTKGKQVGEVHKSKPTHAEVLTDEKVSDGSTTRRVKYKNDDIAEYGKHPTKGLIWRLYKSTGNDIELIKMPDNLNYVKDGVVIKYSFSQTKRRYTGPNVFAGFIGALAECSYSEGIITTGSCFKEGSCFPSAEHVNGRSVDTVYYNDLKKDQTFVDAVINFKFTEVLVGNNKYCKQIKNAEDGGDLHNSHLHSGNFNNESIIIKKQ